MPSPTPSPSPIASPLRRSVVLRAVARKRQLRTRGVRLITRAGERLAASSRQPGRRRALGVELLLAFLDDADFFVLQPLVHLLLDGHQPVVEDGITLGEGEADRGGHLRAAEAVVALGNEPEAG